MANRFPLVIDTTDGNKIKELPSGDNLNLQGSEIVNALNITAEGVIEADAIRIQGQDIQPNTFSGSYTDLTDKPAIGEFRPIGSQNFVNGQFDFQNRHLLYANVFDQLADLPDAGVYHGMFAHVHATGKAYYSHAMQWVELGNSTDIPQSLQDLGIATGTTGQVLTVNSQGELEFQDAQSFEGISSIQFADDGIIQGDNIAILPESGGFVSVGTLQLLNDALPSVASGISLGSETLPFLDVYADQFVSTGGASIGGDIIFQDSSNTISGNDITISGDSIAILPAGENFVDIGNTRIIGSLTPVDVGGGSLGTQSLPFGTIFAQNISGTLEGNSIGDVKGSIFGDDSTLLVDAVEGVLRGDIDFGARTGFIRGDVIAILPNSFGTVDLGNTRLISNLSPLNDIGSDLGSDTTRFDNGYFRNINIDLINGVDPGILTGVGDFTGSFFADDSTQIIDGNNSLVVGNVENQTVRTEVLIVGDNTVGNLGYDFRAKGDVAFTDGLVEFINSTIDSINVLNNSIFNSNLTISGNLTVNGTTTSVNTENTVIKDNIIVLNDGEEGAGVTLGTSGIEIDRGTESNVSFIYDDAIDRWSTTEGISSGTGFFGNLTGDADGDHTGTFTGSIDATGTFNGDFEGSIFALDGTLLVDADNALIPYSVLDGAPTALSDFSNDLDYATIVGDTIALNGLPVDTFMTGNLDAQGNDVENANLVNATGVLNGDITGSVFSDTSTILVDGVNAKIVGDIDNTEVITTTVQGRGGSALNIYRGTNGTVSLGDSASGDVSVSDSGINITSTGGIVINGAVGAVIDIGSSLNSGNVNLGNGSNNIVIDAGAVVIGTEVFYDTDIANWDEAYSWGDHSIENYLTANQNIVFTNNTDPSISNGDGSSQIILYGDEWMMGADNAQIELISDNIKLSGSVLISGDFTSTKALSVDVTGTVFGDDSTILVDGILNTLNLSNNVLGDIGDVDLETSAPTFGQVLKWDGSKWAPADDVTSGGAGLNADTLDGFDGSYYLQWANVTGTPFTLAGFGITDAATDDQGALADSAVQPGDNVSDLTNDAAYVSAGDNITDLANNAGYYKAGDVFQGDLVGSVFADDSTQVIDAVRGGVLFGAILDTPTTVAGYGITDAFDGDYNSLDNLPSIPSTLLDLGIVDGADGNILTANGDGTFSFIASDANTIPNLDDVTITNLQTNDRLFYNGAEWINAQINETLDTVVSNGNSTEIAITVGGLTISDAFSLPTLDGQAGEVLVTDGLGNADWTNTITTSIFSSDSTLLVDAETGSLPYYASNSGDWSGTAPQTIGEAIDRLATLLKTLNSGTGA